MRYLKAFENFDPNSEEDVTHWSVVYDKGSDEGYPQPYLRVSTDDGKYHVALRKFSDREDNDEEGEIEMWDEAQDENN